MKTVIIVILIIFIVGGAGRITFRRYFRPVPEQEVRMFAKEYVKNKLAGVFYKDKALDDRYYWFRPMGTYEWLVKFEDDPIPTNLKGLDGPMRAPTYVFLIAKHKEPLSCTYNNSTKIANCGDFIYDFNKNRQISAHDYLQLQTDNELVSEKGNKHDN